jgi:hypothetical protein
VNIYCIGCKLLTMTQKGSGHYWSTATGWESGTNASFACAKGHWRLFLDRSTEVFDLENAMRAAATCPDYEERGEQSEGATNE